MIVWLGLAMAGVSFEGPLAQGKEVVVMLDRGGAPGRGETVRVVHRPGTVYERERAIGITDGRGRVAWTPEEGGVAEVRGGDDTIRVRIDYGEQPVTAGVLLAITTLTGLGFALTGLRRRRAR